MQILPGHRRLHRAQVRRHAVRATEDLSTPQINISYGSWYLRYLIDRYDGNKTLAVAAYNAGEHNVDTLGRAAPAATSSFNPAKRHPVPGDARLRHSVLDHEKAYRKHYARELGLN